MTEELKGTNALCVFDNDAEYFQFRQAFKQCAKQLRRARSIYGALAVLKTAGPAELPDLLIASHSHGSDRVNALDLLHELEQLPQNVLKKIKFAVVSSPASFSDPYYKVDLEELGSSALVQFVLPFPPGKEENISLAKYVR